MTPAELKTLRESLGLSQQWLADHADVRLRTVQYWEAGNSAVPDDVADMLDRIDLNINRTVQSTVDFIRGIISERGAPECIDLVRYRTDGDLHHYRPDMIPFPASCHAALLARLRRELFKMGVVSRIVYMNPDDYDAWLVLSGMPDSEGARAEWAALQK